MLCDTHIHIGQFFDFYIAPSFIKKMMEQLGISVYAVSSTTQCDENYSKIVDEFTELLELEGNKILPTMWITPEGLKGHIAWYLESDINWRMLKIHPFLNQTGWLPERGMIKEVVDIARELKIPLLIHTGNEDCCKSGTFEPLISDNQDIVFILAHGRPLHDAIMMTQIYKNAYADSAFMPVGDMKKFIDNGLSHKLLWGTDMCIPKHFYPNVNLVEYYNTKLCKFKEICSLDQFDQVTHKNAEILFNINDL